MTNRKSISASGILFELKMKHFSFSFWDKEALPVTETKSNCDFHLFCARNKMLDVRKLEILGVLTAIVQAINPGFSRWSKATKNRRKAPVYQGIAAKKNPNKNLQNKTILKPSIWIHCAFILDLQVRLALKLHKLLHMKYCTDAKDRWQITR